MARPSSSGRQPTGHAPHHGVWRAVRHPAAAGRRATERRGVRCFATISVPEDPQGFSDLGWSTDFQKHYVKGKLIGQGSFGSVYLGIDLHSGREVAVKVMPKQRGKLSKDRTLQKLIKEVDIMQRMQDCSNVVRMLGLYETEVEVMLVLELCCGGDLQKLSDDVGALSERAVALIVYEVLKVVSACHSHGILHGDVKPANFVLKHRTRNPLCSADLDLLFTPWLRAVDFGCSQILGPERFTKRTGTPVYMAPEIFDRNYSWEADMWSVGIMSYQLFARRFPYWDTYEACRSAKLDEVAALVQHAPVRFNYGPWKVMSREGLDFVKGCLRRDYVSRLMVSEALEHPWFDRWLPEAEDAGVLPATVCASGRGEALRTYGGSGTASGSGDGGGGDGQRVVHKGGPQRVGGAAVAAPAVAGPSRSGAGAGAAAPAHAPAAAGKRAAGGHAGSAVRAAPSSAATPEAVGNNIVPTPAPALAAATPAPLPPPRNHKRQGGK